MNKPMAGYFKVLSVTKNISAQGTGILKNILGLSDVKEIHDLTKVNNSKFIDTEAHFLDWGVPHSHFSGDMSRICCQLLSTEAICGDQIALHIIKVKTVLAGAPPPLGELTTLPQP